MGAKHVAPRQRERAGGEIDRVDRGAWQGQRGEDREAARAGAEIEDAADAPRIADRQGAVRQHVADEGARDQGAPVDMEAHAVHIGRAQQVGSRHAQADPCVDQGEQPRALRLGWSEREPGIDVVDGEP